jgi:diguanylate cyclase (GGDEF)-like protein
LILPDTGLDDAREVVSRIQGRIADIRLSVPDVSDPVGITISFGGVNYPDCGNTSEELFRKADKMLYLSKERGRNRCHFWNPDGEPMLSLPDDTNPDISDTRTRT